MGVHRGYAHMMLYRVFDLIACLYRFMHECDRPLVYEYIRTNIPEYDYDIMMGLLRGEKITTIAENTEGCNVKHITRQRDRIIGLLSERQDTHTDIGIFNTICGTADKRKR